MNDYIWNKATSGEQPDEDVMAFLAGQDVLLDRELIHFDIAASIAHARGLAEIGLLDDSETERLVDALEEIGQQLISGELELGPEFEDCHSALESWLTRKLGLLGGKIHTGRSRNDQVAVALRMYLKKQLASLVQCCIEISSILLDRAGAEGDLPMPGYTHLQRAMPSSLGLWLAGHAESFIDNAELAVMTRQWLDASPLGTASGFGVNLPLARASTASMLQFDRLVVNPQCAQNSRGKVEIHALSALAAATRDLRRIAWDLSLFTAEEFAFARLPDRYCTGSSIMPNKRNPDVIELMRAQHAGVVAAQVELESILSLPSGYQRDLQATKPPLMRSFHSGLQALGLLPGLLAAVEWQPLAMQGAVTPEMFATDLCVDMSRQGKPFREAYQEVAAQLAKMGSDNLSENLKNRVSPGACGDLQLEVLRGRLQSISVK